MDTVLLLIQIAGYIGIVAGVVMLIRSGPPAHTCYMRRHPSGVWGCSCGAVQDRHGRPL